MGIRQMSLENFLTIYLSGLASVSVALFLLALLGLFTGFVLIVLAAGCVVLCLKRRLLSRVLAVYLLLCCILGASAAGLGSASPPYEAVVLGDDASIYVATAMQLSKSGGLSYSDSLIAGLTEEERWELFRNRFPRDTTGTFARFPGGVRLVDPSRGTVTFSFYHLFPVWLGLGIQLMSASAFLYVLPLFSILGLTILFALGRHLGGYPVAISVCLIHFWFYPQFYFSHMPASELLSQVLFLAGLWIMVTKTTQEGLLDTDHQLLVGLLWGALFLTRFDSMIYVSLCLLFAFSTLPHFARGLAGWKTLIVSLFFFVSLALYHQMQTGEYLYLIQSSDIVRGNFAVYLIVSALTDCSAWIQQHPIAAAVLALFFCLILMFLISSLLSRTRSASTQICLRISGSLLTATVLLVLWKDHFSISEGLSRLSWISLHASPWILILLLAGIALFVYSKTSGISGAEKKLLLIFFFLPLIGYLMRPMGVTAQPWAMRRFLPIVIPLFFLLSITGWHFILQKLMRSRIAALTVFSVLTCAILWFSIDKTLILLKDPLYSRVIHQTSRLAGKLPEDAVIILPDSLAALHLEVPLQYFSDRDTVLLPLGARKEAQLAETMIGFLSRQVRQRPVIFLGWQNETSLLKKYFRLEEKGRESIEFFFVPRVAEGVVPARTGKAIFVLSVYRLRLGTQAPGR